MLGKRDKLPPYPKGSTYGALLKWHLHIRGTRGDVTKDGTPWMMRHFAQQIFPNSQFDDVKRNLSNWKTPGKAPPKEIEIARRIEEVLFGTNPTNPDLQQWKTDLRLAWLKYYSPNEQLEEPSNGSMVSAASRLELPALDRNTNRASTRSQTDLGVIERRTVPKPTDVFVGRNAERDKLVSVITATLDKFAILVQGAPVLARPNSPRQSRTTIRSPHGSANVAGLFR